VRVSASLVSVRMFLVHWEEEDHELFRVSVGLPASLSVCLSVCLSVGFAVFGNSIFCHSFGLLCENSSWCIRVGKKEADLCILHFVLVL
jgi:hypothetical protein